MGKASKRKQKSLKKKGVGVSANAESYPFGGYATVVSFILIAATTLLIYSNTFQGPFLFDDKDYILGNPGILDLKNFLDFSGTRHITFLSFAINYALGGYNTFGYHLANTIIHLINGLLVWWLVILTLRTPAMERVTGGSQLRYFIALIAALIFVAHPVQTQAVTYITQRFASLATVFYLLSLALFVKWRLYNGTLKPGFRTVIYAASLLSAVIAMKTKEISFTLPFIIVLYEFAFFDDKTFGERLLSLTPFILTLAIIPLTLFSPEVGPGETTSGAAETVRQMQIEELMTISPYYYLITQFRVIVTYIRLLFLPINQNVDYDYALYDSFFNPEVFFSFLALLSIFGLAVYLFIRSRKTNNAYGLLASVGVLWFFITLSVESSVIPIKDVIFEHRLYLPSIGAVIAFGSAAFYVFDYMKPKASALIAACVLLAVTAFPLGVAAYNRNFVWKDDLTIWEDVVVKSPGKARGHNNLGVAYKKAGLHDEALQEFREALRVEPDYTDAHNNIGELYSDQGRSAESIQEYKEALRLNPDYALVHYNLGLAYYNGGRIAEAVEEYGEALRLKPDYADAHYNLGLAYYKQGRMAEAIEEYEDALKIKPGYAKARFGLGAVYYKLGRELDAVKEYKEALRLKPDHADAHNNLGNAYFNLGRLDEAIEEYSEALRLRYDYAHVHNNLGVVYNAQGRLDEAIEEYKEALRLKHDFAEAHFNLGTAYGKKTLLDTAIKEFKQALRYKPDYAEAHFNLGLSYRQKGSRDEAIREFEEVLKIRPDDATTRNILESLTTQ